MLLYSCKKIHNNEWKLFWIGKDVLERVEDLSMKKYVVVMTYNYPMFEWLLEVKIDEEHEEHKEE